MKIRVVIPPRYEAPPTRIEDLRPGDVADDGSIYLGRYSGSEWFVAAKDAQDKQGGRLTLTFNEALAYARKLTAHDQDDWKLPSLPVLNMMLHHHADGAFKGTYVDNEVNRPGYWSSMLEGTSYARSIHFTRRATPWMHVSRKILLRCVRSVRKDPTP